MSEVRRQVALPPRPNWGWQDAAACRGREVVLFFGPDGRKLTGAAEEEVESRVRRILEAAGSNSDASSAGRVRPLARCDW